MKKTTMMFGCLLAALFSGAAEVAAWRGDALKGWTAGARDCKDVRVEQGVLKGVVTGRDSQLYATLPTPVQPKGNHRLSFRIKASGPDGRGQLFWIREGDKVASEARQKAFHMSADGQWHVCRIRPCWSGPAIRRLRLDLPAGFAGGTPFEISEIVLTEEGDELDVDTSRQIGVRFSLQMPPGLHYCTLVWGGDMGGGEFGFTPATDGARHDYWFDLRGTRIRGWGPRAGKKCWEGRVNCFSVEQVRYDRELPAEAIAFVDTKPDIAPDPTIRFAYPGEAIPRTGRPFIVEVVVRNLGTRPAEKLSFALDGLPPGVKVLDAADLSPEGCVPGSEGADSIWGDMRPEPVNERVFRIRLSDLGVGRHVFGVTLKAEGVAPRRAEVVADVKPSLGLAKADYPAEPQPVDTAPYEIGAFLFPGWTDHRWHAIWSHSPWRKPVLGWYDEEKPETIDWQIKHLVENGVSFVFVDWYWYKGRQHLNHWMKAFKGARFRRHLKWSLMWANHTAPGTHSEKDQENVTRFWIENYFRDPQYQTIDGKPVVSIWSMGNMNRDVKDGGCRKLLDISRRVAREAGFKGIWFVAVRGPDQEDAEFLRKFADNGFDMTCVYKYAGSIPGVPFGPAGSRPFKWLADTSLNHWRALKKNSTLPFLPSLSTAWDDRPWRGEIGWEITGINASDFRRICADARTYSDETGDRMLLMGPLDEWGEGSIGYPNAELGFGMLEAVRDAFGKRPAAGWPVNHAPEDVGLVCPQRPNN